MNLAWMVPLATMVAGVAALYPLRAVLPRWALPVAAFPVGWMGWALAAVLTTALRAPFTVPTALLGVAVYAAVVALLAVACVRRPEPRPFAFSPLPAAVGIAVIAAVSAAAAAIGRAVIAGDSLGHEAYATYLLDTGSIYELVMSDRGPLTPALHAAERLFGAPLAYVSFPVLAFGTAALLAYAMYADLRLRPRTRLVLVAAVVGLMVTNSVFVFTAFYVHTHMMAALQLLLGVAGLRLATAEGAEGSRDAWLFVGGVGAATVAIARPDGLPYVLVIALMYVATHFPMRFPRRSILAFFGPMLGLLWLVNGLAFTRLGLWQEANPEGAMKPDGAFVLALSILLTLFAGSVLGASSWPALRRRLSRPGLVVWVVLAGDAAVIALARVARPASFLKAMDMMAQNLLRVGAWGVFWYVAIGLGVAGVAWRLGRRREDLAGPVSFAVLQFFAVAVVVHGVGHPGRLSWGDSLNRIVFHAVPLVFWFGATLASEVVSALAAPEPVAAEEDPAAV